MKHTQFPEKLVYTVVVVYCDCSHSVILLKFLLYSYCLNKMFTMVLFLISELLILWIIIHDWMIVSQDDGLTDLSFMNGLPAANTWCTVTFSCVGGPKNKFITLKQEIWKNWRKEPVSLATFQETCFDLQ